VTDKKSSEQKSKPDNNLIVLGVWLAIVIVMIGAYFLFLQPKSSLTPTAKNPLDAEINLLNKRLADNPKDVPALIQLGQDYSKQKRFDEALDIFKIALKNDSSNTVALVNMASTKMAMGKGKEAGPLLDKALTIKPDYDFAKYIKAIYLTKIEKDYPAALSILADLKKEISDKSKIAAVNKLITQIKQEQNQAESSSTTPNSSTGK